MGVHRLRANGYGWDRSFHFDITRFLINGRSNEIAVRVKKLAYLSGIDGGVHIFLAAAVQGRANKIPR